MNKNKGITYTVISCLAIVSVVVGLFVYSTVAEKELTKDQYKLLKFYELNTKRELSAFNIFNNEEPFTKANLEGKWDLVFLGFASCPDMCPMTMKKMAMTANILQEEPEVLDKINFIIISVDPNRDTPEIMNQYAKVFNPSFIGLAGGIKDIYQLSLNLTLPFTPIIDSEDKNYDMDHSMNLALINPKGQYHGFFKTPHDPKMMAEALTSIIKFSN
ncbi:MAG: SCO family protein [Gammaproteobacteria bacterium]|tara:strand:- start:3468 stop:4115 length:648 start_codon:yes stop_codon:yes gene_type:complete